jgi:MFS transporter, YNFM family, putative membrane transport protein
LLADPYDLSQAVVGLLSVVYLSGIYSSAKIGSLADRLGRRRVLWATIVLMLAGITLTLFSPLPLMIIGMLMFTFGFFGAHSVASSWIGRRALQGQGAGVVAVPVQLLRRVEHCRDGRWVFLALRRMERHWRVYRRLLIVALLVALKLAKFAGAQTVGAGLPAMWPEESPQAHAHAQACHRRQAGSYNNRQPIKNRPEPGTFLLADAYS